MYGFQLVPKKIAGGLRFRIGLKKILLFGTVYFDLRFSKSLTVINRCMSWVQFAVVHSAIRCQCYSSCFFQVRIIIHLFSVFWFSAFFFRFKNQIYAVLVFGSNFKMKGGVDADTNMKVRWESLSFTLSWHSFYLFDDFVIGACRHNLSSVYLSIFLSSFCSAPFFV
jgi:hypothetical protein